MTVSWSYDISPKRLLQTEFAILLLERIKMEFKMTKYRDAGTGRYVTKEFAKKHPGTTIGENSKPKSQRKHKK
ncbi:hypothetical protein SCJ60_14065 [Legionella pneumophila serogroup 9]